MAPARGSQRVSEGMECRVWVNKFLPNFLWLSSRPLATSSIISKFVGGFRFMKAAMSHFARSDSPQYQQGHPTYLQSLGRKTNLQEGMEHDHLLGRTREGRQLCQRL